MNGTQMMRKSRSIGMKFCRTMNRIWPRNIPAPIITEIVPITEERMPEGEDSAGMVRMMVSDIDQRPPIEQP